jgi:hypothetical protein
MKLEDQVCSLELAKRLKELGVKQESLFYWVSIQGKYFIQYAIFVDSEYQSQLTYSAFTVAELGEGLPEKVLFNEVMGDKRLSDFYDGNEADARAKMRIYLIENGLVKI